MMPTGSRHPVLEAVARWDAGAAPRQGRVERAEYRVFVPGILGAGVLVSIGLLVADAVSLLTGGRSARRAVHRSAALAARDVLAGTGAPPPPSPVRLRSARAYWVIGTALTALGTYGLIGSTWNYWNPAPGLDWAEGVGWLWAVCLVPSAAFFALGVVALLLATGRGRLGLAFTPFVLRTPLGRRTKD